MGLNPCSYLYLSTPGECFSELVAYLLYSRRSSSCERAASAAGLHRFGSVQHPPLSPLHWNVPSSILPHGRPRRRLPRRNGGTQISVTFRSFAGFF